MEFFESPDMDCEDSKNNLLVYVVDDNALLGQVTAQIVETAGFRTRTFSNGKEGNAALSSEDTKPDLLITDFDLGDIEGFDLIETAKRTIPGIQCLLVSGSVRMEKLKEHAIKPDHFLAKPFKPDELVALVQQMARTPR